MFSDIDSKCEAFSALYIDAGEVIEEFRRLSEGSEGEEVAEAPTTSTHDVGSGAVDAGRGKGVIGNEAHGERKAAMKKAGLSTKIPPLAKPTTFSLGNQGALESPRSVEIQRRVGGRVLARRLCVVKDTTPLPVGKPMLEALGAKLDALRGEMAIARIDVAEPPRVAAIGNCQLNAREMSNEESNDIQAAEVDAMTTEGQGSPTAMADAMTIEELTALEEFAAKASSGFRQGRAGARRRTATGLTWRSRGPKASPTSWAGGPGGT